MDPMSLNNAIPTVTQADLHLGARPTVRGRSSSPSRAAHGGLDKAGKTSPSTSPAPSPSAPTSKDEETHTYPPVNPNGHTTNIELPNPFSSGGAAIVDPGRSKERSSLTKRVGNFFRSKSKSQSRGRSRSPAAEGTLHPTIIA